MAQDGLRRAGNPVGEDIGRRAPTGLQIADGADDGLRAVAVLPVIFFHAGVEIFSGGYVGVDVFFVISGYLITSILMRDLAQELHTVPLLLKRKSGRISSAQNPQ